MSVPSPLRKSPFDFRQRPPYPRRPPRIQKLKGEDVTVCIASICDPGRVIVAVCDSKLSTGYTSSDRVTLKARRLSKSWGFMFAGEDVSPIVPIEEALQEELKSRPNKLPEVVSLARKAYQEQLQVKATTLNASLQDTSLGLELLIFGYDERSNAHIFTVFDPNAEVAYHDVVGFCAIGSVGYAARSMLYFYGQNKLTHLSTAIYHTLTAKFMAESASDVGKDTFTVVLERDGKAVPLPLIHVESIRDVWEEEGKPKMPLDVPSRVSDMFRAAQRFTPQALDLLGVPHDWRE